MACRRLWPLVLAWINLYPNIEKRLHPLYSLRWNYTYPLSAVEFWAQMVNFNPHLTGHLIMHPWWDYSLSVLRKSAPARYQDITWASVGVPFIAPLKQTSMKFESKYKIISYYMLISSIILHCSLYCRHSLLCAVVVSSVRQRSPLFPLTKSRCSTWSNESSHLNHLSGKLKIQGNLRHHTRYVNYLNHVHSEFFMEKISIVQNERNITN